MARLRKFIQYLLYVVPLAAVVLPPLIEWLIECFRQERLIRRLPYSLNDVHLALFFVLLLVIYHGIQELQRKSAGSGDESHIISNRNQSDYYGIWDACRKNRTVRIEAFGHSFNTLWFNFIKKFLYEAAKTGEHQRIEITLISTRKGANCFGDVRSFYEGLEAALKKKTSIRLVETEQPTFFTGVSVNREILWLSIREPHSAKKENEHVREWTRGTSETASKMVDWFAGIIDYLQKNAPVEDLSSNSGLR